MPIAARLLMILACGPLLWPAGLCVCRVDASQRVHVEAEPAEPCCGCCHHEPPQNTPPFDAPHAPDCPAAHLFDQAPPPDSASWLAVADFPPRMPTSLANFGCDTASRPVTSPAIRPGGPPRYLAHCALLI